MNANIWIVIMGKLMLYLILLYRMGGRSAWTQSVQDKSRVYSFGIVPKQPANTLAESWMPVLQEISHRTGVSSVFPLPSVFLNSSVVWRPMAGWRTCLMSATRIVASS